MRRERRKCTSCALKVSSLCKYWLGGASSSETGSCSTSFDPIVASSMRSVRSPVCECPDYLGDLLGLGTRLMMASPCWIRRRSRSFNEVPPFRHLRARFTYLACDVTAEPSRSNRLIDFAMEPKKVGARLGSMSAWPQYGSGSGGKGTPANYPRWEAADRRPAAPSPRRARQDGWSVADAKPGAKALAEPSSARSPSRQHPLAGSRGAFLCSVRSLFCAKCLSHPPLLVSGPEHVRPLLYVALSVALPPFPWLVRTRLSQG